MTDEKTDATSWIERRFRCSPLWILDDLCRIAEASVERVNALPCTVVKDNPFRVENRVEEGSFTVLGWPIGSEINGSPPRRVTFRVDGDRLTITPDVVVTRQWDPMEEKCFLCVARGDDKPDERRYTSAMLSQMILEPLFFI